MRVTNNCKLHMC